MHLAYGAFSVLMMILACLMFLGMGGVMIANEGDRAFAVVMAIMVAFFFVIYVVLAVPSFLAGYALLRQAKFAKILGIIAAVIGAMSFPFGTALCVYTLWFLFGEQGRALYDNTILPPPPPVWARTPASERQEKYEPPRPGNWR